MSSAKFYEVPEDDDWDDNRVPELPCNTIYHGPQIYACKCTGPFTFFNEDWPPDENYKKFMKNQKKKSRKINLCFIC